MTTMEMKSKVMTLGNRLAARGNDRRAAFIRAWAIVKAGSVTLAVKGVSFGNRQEALKRLAAYSPEFIQVFIMPEPENTTDNKAAAVMVGVQNGRGFYRLGYLPRDVAPAAASLKATSLIVIDGDVRGARITLSA